MRGGSFGVRAVVVRFAYRKIYLPTTQLSFNGFRPSRTYKFAAQAGNPQPQANGGNKPDVKPASEPPNDDPVEAQIPAGFENARE